MEKMGLRLNTTNKSEGRKEKLEVFRKCNSYEQTWYKGEKTNLRKRWNVEGPPAAARQQHII